MVNWEGENMQFCFIAFFPFSFLLLFLLLIPLFTFHIHTPRASPSVFLSKKPKKTSKTRKTGKIAESRGGEGNT